MGAIVFLPISFLFMEIFFHIHMNLSFDCIGIFILFTFSIGAILVCLLNFLSEKKQKIIIGVTLFLVASLYTAEMIAKTVLQEFYQLFGAVSTAASNNILNFSDSIITGIGYNWMAILIMYIPFIIFLIFIFKYKDILKFDLVNNKIKIISISAGLISYILAMVLVYSSWNMQFQPKELYCSDMYIGNQIEDFGLLTMLRLDLQHTFFGVDEDVNFNFAHADNLPADDSKMMLGDSNKRVDGSDVSEENKNNIINTEDLLSEEIKFLVDINEKPIGHMAKIYHENILSIDMNELEKACTSKYAKWIYEYMKNTKATRKNQYTATMKDYNLIFITAEGFLGSMIDEKLTPTMYMMQNEGFVFNNFYTPLHFTSTSGGEYRNLTGLYPKSGMPISMIYTGVNKISLPFTLAHQLKSQNYEVDGYHPNYNIYERDKSHPNLGYDWHQGGMGFVLETNKYGNDIWPQSDLYMIEETIDEYIDQDKFHAYYMSISGHMPYNFAGNSMSKKNYDIVKDLDYSETTKAYIAANLELEYALQYLVERLKEKDLLEKTLIVVVPDHIPYFDVAVIDELAGKTHGTDGLQNIDESNIDFDVYRNALLIWSASMEEAVQVDKVCSQVDVLATLSNLMGIDYDSRLLAGKDILSESSNLVITASRSWISDYGVYNSYNNSFELADGFNMTDEKIDKYVENMNTYVRNTIDFSNRVRDDNFYKNIEKYIVEK